MASVGILEKSNCFSISSSYSFSLRMLYVRSLHKYSLDPSFCQRGEASGCSFSFCRRTALYARCDSSAFTPLSREMSTEPDSTTMPAFPAPGLMSTSLVVNTFSAFSSLASSLCAAYPPCWRVRLNLKIEKENNQVFQKYHLEYRGFKKLHV